MVEELSKFVGDFYGFLSIQRANIQFVCVRRKSEIYQASCPCIKCKMKKMTTINNSINMVPTKESQHALGTVRTP